MIIRNFGLMWDRDCVAWSGVRGAAGHLKGFGPIGSPKKYQVEADFREQIGIYVLYDNRSILYVGQAGSGENDLYIRLKQHLSDHLADRWNRFSWFGVRKVNQDGSLSKVQGELKRTIAASETLDLLEGLLITTLEPSLNKQGARWKNIDQYFQTKEGWDGWSDRELLSYIADQLTEEDED